MFENISSINYQAVSFEKFLKTNNLTWVDRPYFTSDFNFFENNTVYVLYNTVKDVPRLERVTFKHLDSFFEIKFPVMGIAHSYKKSKLAINEFEAEIVLDRVIIDKLDNLVYQAQKQICPTTPYLVKGYFFDAGLNTHIDADVRNTISRNFGIIFYKEKENNYDSRNFSNYRF